MSKITRHFVPIFECFTFEFVSKKKKRQVSFDENYIIKSVCVDIMSKGYTCGWACVGRRAVKDGNS